MIGYLTLLLLACDSHSHTYTPCNSTAVVLVCLQCCSATGQENDFLLEFFTAITLQYMFWLLDAFPCAVSHSLREQSLRHACRTRDSGGDTKALLQVAAQLHQIQGRYILALTTFLHQQQCLTLPASIACSSPLHQRKLLHAYRTRAPGGDTEALLQVAAQLYQIWGTYDLALTVSLQQQQCVTLPASFACSSTLHQKMLLHAHRTRAPGGDTEALLQVAAQLYQIQGRYDLALAIFLQQQQPAVFDFIQEHHLLPVLHERVAQLLSIDEERAVALLMQEYDQIPASTVVSSIQVFAACSVHQLPHGSGDLCRTWTPVCQ